MDNEVFMAASRKVTVSTNLLLFQFGSPLEHAQSEYSPWSAAVIAASTLTSVSDAFAGSVGDVG